MQSIQLFLNGQNCDLSTDNPIALTFQINNLAEVKNQQGNTSKQFKLPLTQNNRRILGFPDDIKVTNNIPYTQLHARVIQDGIEIIPDGLAEIGDVTQDAAAITIVSGNVDFFEKIDGKIYDMGDSKTVFGAAKPWAPYIHTWDLNTAAYSQPKTTGFIYPVIDYGSILNLKPFKIDVRQLRPAFFLKTAIDLIVSNSGYKSAGSLLEDPMYNKILIPFAGDNLEHGTDYQTQPDTIGMLAFTVGDKTVVHYAVSDPNGKGTFTFPQIDNDPKSQFDGTTFTAQEIFTGEVLVTIPKFYFYGKVNDNVSSVDIKIKYEAAAGGELQFILTYDLSDGFTRDNSPGSGSGSNEQGYNTFDLKKLSTDIDFQIGDRLTVVWEFVGGRTESFNLFAGASLSIKAKNQNVLFGQEVQCERIFPDINQKDLLKDNLQRFGIICQTDNTNRTVTFASFKDIVKNIPIAKNWTGKCVNIGKTNSFQLGSYAQANQLKYKTDDAITDKYADDTIYINDKTLPATADLFTGQFAPSLSVPFAGAMIAQIRKIAEDSEPGDYSFTESTSPRVLVDEKLNLFLQETTGITIEFTDGENSVFVNDMISAPYFYKINGAYSLMWKDVDGFPGLRSIYYKELERILKQTKVVTRYFVLTPRDISELDLLIPIFIEQDSAFFYINKIDSWIKGQACKVELVKLGEI